MLDFDAYLERIGLPGGGSIAEVHRAHVSSIPFENLDSHRGVGVSLAAKDIERKLVKRRRGGYCFEQNLLLKAALEQMGAEVDTHLARVRWHANGAVRPRTHLVLRASIDGAQWLADVGFGRCSLLEPLPFGPGGEHEQSGWMFRVLEDGEELVLQTIEDDDWVDVYGFQSFPSPTIDLETSNWWVSTHPASPFVTGLIVARLSSDGRRTALCDWGGPLMLSEQTPAGEHSSELPREQIPELLSARFALHGFALDSNGRVTASS